MLSGHKTGFQGVKYWKCKKLGVKQEAGLCFFKIFLKYAASLTYNTNYNIRGKDNYGKKMDILFIVEEVWVSN